MMSSNCVTDAKIVHKACDEILGGSRLRRIIGVILYLGNKVNGVGSCPKEHASALAVNALMKLHQGKAFDRKTSFLQYAAMIIRRNCPSLLLFKDDLPTLKLAEKVAWKQSMDEVEKIEKTLTQMRNTILAAGGPNLSADQEFHLLQSSHVGRFVFNGFLQMNALYSELEGARLAFEALSDYFGEEDLETQTFLHSMYEFCSIFDEALMEAVSSEKQKLRGTRLPPSASTSSSCSRHVVHTKRQNRETNPMERLLSDIRKR